MRQQAATWSTWSSGNPWARPSVAATPGSAGRSWTTRCWRRVVTNPHQPRQTRWLETMGWGWRPWAGVGRASGSLAGGQFPLGREQPKDAPPGRVAQGGEVVGDQLGAGRGGRQAEPGGLHTHLTPLSGDITIARREPSSTPDPDARWRHSWPAAASTGNWAGRRPRNSISARTTSKARVRPSTTLPVGRPQNTRARAARATAPMRRTFLFA